VDLSPGVEGAARFRSTSAKEFFGAQALTVKKFWACAIPRLSGRDSSQSYMYIYMYSRKPEHFEKRGR
jgi:hypothetical protein